MKRIFRTIVGMMLLSIPLCVSAQDNSQQQVDNLQGKVDRMPKFSGFVQGMYLANFDEDFKLTDNTFRMRRVRLSVEGNLAKGLTYKIQGDFSRSPMLVDAFLKYKPCNEFAIQIGQFKTPFSIESPINPSTLKSSTTARAYKSLSATATFAAWVPWAAT